MHKVAARHGARAEAERNLAASLGTAMLFEGQAETSAVGGSAEVPDAGMPLSAPPPPPQLDAQDGRGSEVAPGHPQAPVKPARKGPKASTIVLTAGGIALGLGVTLIGIGFAASTATSGTSLLLGLTFGALLGIAGIITLIVGLVLLAAKK
jgi:hypothetical protein